MARASVYNHNYPGKKIDKGCLTPHDAITITQEYMELLSKEFYTPEDSTYSAYDHLFFQRFKVYTYETLARCLRDSISVHKCIDVRYIKMRVNMFLATDAVHETFKKLMCSYLEKMLFQSDAYNGWNNALWCNGGSKLWHEDYPYMYRSDEDHKIAMDAMNNPKYNSSEYSRQYF